MIFFLFGGFIYSFFFKIQSAGEAIQFFSHCVVQLKSCCGFFSCFLFIELLNLILYYFPDFTKFLICVLLQLSGDI